MDAFEFMAQIESVDRLKVAYEASLLDPSMSREQRLSALAAWERQQGELDRHGRALSACRDGG